MLSALRAELRKQNWFAEQYRATQYGQLAGFAALGNTVRWCLLIRSTGVSLSGFAQIRAGHARPGIHASTEQG